MIVRVYAIRDRAVDTFMQPWFAPSDAAATRMFKDVVNRVSDDSNIYKHPDDFDLYSLGSFDDGTGVLSPDSVRQIAVGKSVAVR